MCRKLIRPSSSYVTHDTPDDGPKLGDTRNGRRILAVGSTIKREYLTSKAYQTVYFDGWWRGVPDPRKPLFCTNRCMMQFAMAAYRAGYRIIGS
jgi:hypothetical protein